MIIALNKKGINVSSNEYWKEWDVKQTQAAVNAAGFEKEYEDWIWEKERQPFEVF